MQPAGQMCPLNKRIVRYIIRKVDNLKRLHRVRLFIFM